MQEPCDFNPDYHPHPDEVVEGEPEPYPSLEEEAEWFEYEDDCGRFRIMPGNAAALSTIQACGSYYQALLVHHNIS